MEVVYRCCCGIDVHKNGWPVGEHSSFLGGIYENAAHSPVGRRSYHKIMGLLCTFK